MKRRPVGIGIFGGGLMVRESASAFARWTHRSPLRSVHSFPTETSPSARLAKINRRTQISPIDIRSLEHSGAFSWAKASGRYSAGSLPDLINVTPGATSSNPDPPTTGNRGRPAFFTASSLAPLRRSARPHCPQVGHTR
jgi:hypothetical protein